jgi:hypothetical protein
MGGAEMKIATRASSIPTAWVIGARGAQALLQ